MKIGIYADAHFSLNSSILLGTKSSLDGRLSYLLESFEWMYDLFKKNKVENIIDLGDLTDSCILRAEEITAISKSLSFNTEIPEYHILGNHERVDELGNINSVNFIENITNHHIIKSITEIEFDGKKCVIIPYNIYENGCFDDLSQDQFDYGFSHIDIFGADTGGWSLKSGLSPIYITNKFKLLINGHIHNGSWVSKNKIVNIGAISGQNFSSKSINWEPSVVILDTKTNKLKFYENPHALRFVNITCNEISDVLTLMEKLNKESKYALQIKVPLSIADDTREILNQNQNILSSRLRTLVDKSELGDMTYEEIEKVNTLEGGFSYLVNFINEQDSLPFNKDDILKVVNELEKNEEVAL